MKFSTVLVALAVCLTVPVASESQAHLRLHVGGDKDICYTQCPSGQYCPNGEHPHTCRGPKSGECFNPATGAYQKGCDRGFTCKNNKCVYG